MSQHYIEIKEEPDPSSYFYFTPAIVKSTFQITWDDNETLDDFFCIEEGDIDCFLAYFLFKYFDENLIYNKERFDGVYIEGFAWWIDENFFTYDQIENMCQEIEECAKLLAVDYENELLDGVKERFSIFYMCDQDENDYKNRDSSDEAMKRHVDVVIDFYNRFVTRIRKMMKDTPETNLILITGP